MAIVAHRMLANNKKKRQARKNASKQEQFFQLNPDEHILNPMDHSDSTDSDDADSEGSMLPSIPHERFYRRVDGHDREYLNYIRSTVGKNKGCIFLAGDSSLDNKLWFTETANALNGYEEVLDPPIMKQDVSYWVNLECTQRDLSLYCLNTAVEASSLNSRSWGILHEQDRLIKESIGRNDYLIVSIGGNDLALSPQLCTVVNLFILSWCTPNSCVENYSSSCIPNLCQCCPSVDMGYCSCGLQGCICGFPPAIGYFVDLFKNRVENYVRRILPKNSRRYPKKIAVCMMYFLDEQQNGGWTNCTLKCCMRYDSVPLRLQTAIRSIFKLATQKIHIDGTEIVAVPLFEALDGKTSPDYLKRVMPSPSGGQKMAKVLMDALQIDSNKKEFLPVAPASIVMEH